MIIIVVGKKYLFGLGKVDCDLWVGRHCSLPVC